MTRLKFGIRIPAVHPMGVAALRAFILHTYGTPALSAARLSPLLTAGVPELSLIIERPTLGLVQLDPLWESVSQALPAEPDGRPLALASLARLHQFLSSH